MFALGLKLSEFGTRVIISRQFGNRRAPPRRPRRRDSVPRCDSRWSGRFRQHGPRVPMGDERARKAAQRDDAEGSFLGPSEARP